MFYSYLLAAAVKLDEQDVVAVCSGPVNLTVLFGF